MLRRVFPCLYMYCDAWNGRWDLCYRTKTPVWGILGGTDFSILVSGKGRTQGRAGFTACGIGDDHHTRVSLVEGVHRLHRRYVKASQIPLVSLY